ncbi:MAG: hypothetical protein QOD66_662 [Solirubrobacteraceae bacterium]|jgi:predicted short-subunit dehydrogenase-like oxidoreductase (DUF2520 family)|nr:hypothetical protein [Solirubrobacteraceae bacterium]
MRELERNFPHSPTSLPRDLTGVGVVGRGRLGTALAAALRDAGYRVAEPAGRGVVPPGDVLLLCVPDSEIAAAAQTVAGPARFVGHTSGATPLRALEASGAELFGLHPLQTVTGAGARFAGCGCAVAGSTQRALELAEQIATDLDMVPFSVEDSQRAAYHATASIASNFLVTLEAEAEALAADAGIEGFDARQMLGQLVRTTVENWISLGPERALTGPVARGDSATVAAQRAAIAARRPQLEPLFDALVERTEALAGRTVAV